MFYRNGVGGQNPPWIQRKHDMNDIDDAERSRIARELFDRPFDPKVAIEMQLDVIRRHLEKCAGEIADLKAGVSKLTDEIAKLNGGTP